MMESVLFRLIAKPTVDSLLELSEDTDLQSITTIMEEAGYVINRPPSDLVMYLKGYISKGFQGADPTYSFAV